MNYRSSWIVRNGYSLVAIGFISLLALIGTIDYRETLDVEISSIQFEKYNPRKATLVISKVHRNQIRKGQKIEFYYKKQQVEFKILALEKKRPSEFDNGMLLKVGLVSDDTEFTKDYLVKRVLRGTVVLSNRKLIERIFL